MDAKNNALAVHVNNHIEFIDYDIIVQLKADNNYTEIFLTNDKKIVSCHPLGYCELKLDKNIFFRCHKSHIINLRKVKKYCHDAGLYLVMADKSIIPLARERKKKFLKLFVLL